MQQRSKQQSEEQGEAEQQRHAERAFLVAFDGIDPAVEYGQDEHEGQRWAGTHETEVDVGADGGAYRRRNQAQREQHVGVAQHLLLLRGTIQRRAGGAGLHGSEFRLHDGSPLKFDTPVRLSQRRKSCNWQSISASGLKYPLPSPYFGADAHYSSPPCAPAYAFRRACAAG